MNAIARNARSRGIHWLVAAGVALLPACSSLPTPTQNYDFNRRLVFPVVATGPGTIDGLANEPAWTSNSFKFAMVHGGPSNTVFRGVADANFIYIYAEVEDPEFNASDVLVIGLNPSNANNDYRRIHIFPCPNAGVCAANGNNQAPNIQYWTPGTFNGTAWTWVSAPTPAGLEAKVATATGAVKIWAVEVKIPRGAPLNFVASNFFGLFVDVVMTDPTLGQAVQYTWPPDQLIAGPDENDVLANLEGGTVGPTHWGNATLHGGFGNGVSIYSNDISSNHPTDPTLIRINDPNTFFGTASNYSTQGGTLVAANSVRATFKIANFGLGGGYINVPGSGNPTAAANIAAASANTYATGTWSLSPQEKTNYTANPHQCIQVELTSTDPNVVFVNASAQRNMDFVTTSSPFRAGGVISTKGREGAPGGRAVGFTLRESFVNFDPTLTWTTTIANATQVGTRVYRAEVPSGADLALDVTVDPPKVTIPSETVRIPPGTGSERNPAVKVAVRPGDVVTIVSSGTIDIDGQPIGAAGQPMGDRRGDSRLRVAGARRIGALLGSFDDFKSVFLIGNASSFKVPGGAQTLLLKINDDAAQYEKQRGEGYALQVIRTPVAPWMVAANPELAREVRGDDVLVTTGANVPTWLLRGERDTGRVLRIGRETFRTYQSVGSFGHIVRQIN